MIIDEEFDGIEQYLDRELDDDPDATQASVYAQFVERMTDLEGPMGVLLLTEQMSLKRGLKLFGVKGEEAVVKEMRQLHDMTVIDPVHKHTLTIDDLRRSLNYLMFLKEK